ncbi:MAG: hypothetical protein HOV80_17605 [Polyangiaceae bacterium]|nr:hypothetical protein [Polyangiaceae bacterium]
MLSLLVFANTTPVDGLGTLATQGILGLLLSISLGCNMWLVLKILAVQEGAQGKRDEVHEKRVGDAHDFANRIEASAERDRAAQSELAKGMGQIAEVQREGNRSVDRNTTALEAHTRVIEGTLREAVRRRAADSSTETQAVRRDARRDP